MSDPAVTDIYRLTPLQEGILFHTLMEPEAGYYVDQLTVTLDLSLVQDGGGAAEMERIRAAFAALVARHAVLRTGFIWEGQAEPLQLVAAEAPLAFSALDWSDGDPGEVDGRVAALIAQERAGGFDLARPPLLRVAAARLPDGAVQLIVTYHHIILDAWSVALLFAEFRTLWRDPAAPLAPAPAFRGYVRDLAARERADAPEFWRAALAGLAGPTPLVAGAAPDPHAAGMPGIATLRLPAAETAEIAAAARRLAITQASLVHAAWARVLAIRAGSRDIVFGVTFAGRPADTAAAAGLIGLCINTLPLRLPIDPAMAVGAWLRDVHARLAAVRAHEFTPLARVRDWSGQASGVPLFESVMAFENIPGIGTRDAAPDDGERPAARDGRYLFRTNYPVNLLVVPGERLSLRINYDTARYGQAEIEQCLADFASVALRLARTPEAPLATIGLLAAAEEAALAPLRQGPQSADPGARPVHLAVADHAARDPDAVAVTDGARDWSYGWIEARANGLARLLLAQGVAREDRVLVHAHRSAELAAALLAIFKIGAVYVPLDPMYPAPRLASMAGIAAPALALCAAELRATLPPVDCPIVMLDAPAAPAPPPEVTVGADNAAYVIFTSGSSGVPKGIVLAHRGLANMLADWNALFAVDRSARLLQFASISFDASLWEILSALTAGATLCIASRATLYGADELLGALRDLRISHALLPPSLLGSIDPGALPDLRGIAAIGERCTGDIARRWSVGRRFYNAYGPAEGTITDCVYERRAGDERAGDPPIGWPMANVRLDVLDADGNPVPPGVPGELAIGGVNVARGYIGRPGDTAARFVPDPRGAWPGARLYLSGDMVVMQRDGALVYLGRGDDQVKIRGTRIEPGEVETALRAHPGVRDAVVLAQDWPGVADRRLVGYVVARDPDAPPDTLALRAFLRERLAEAMVPSAFVALAAFPLSANGKIARARLPAPQWERAADIAVYRAPGNPLEARLAALWARVLRLERVGVDDNYFDLGGDSIISIRLVAAAQREGIALSPRDIFAHQTVAALAQAKGGAAVLPAEDDPAAAGERPACGLPMQRRFLDWMGGPAAHYNQAIWLSLDAGLSAGQVREALARLVDRHDALRLRVDPDGAGGWQFVVGARGGDPAFVRLAPGADADAAVAAVHASLDPVAGRVFAALWLDPAEADAAPRLLLAAHHLAVDALSWTILLGDLAQALAGAPGIGRAPSFADAAAAFDQAVARGLLADRADEWRRLLAERPLAFGDRATDAPLVATTDRVPAARLLAQLPRGAHGGDLVLAALAAAGGAGGLIDLESDGRSWPEMPAAENGAVGWFTAIAPFALPDPAGFGRDAIAALAAARQAWEARSAGYGALLGGNADLRGPPRPLLFNWMGDLGARLPEDAPFHLARADAGAARDPALPRPYRFELNAWIADGALVLAWQHPDGAAARALAARIAALLAEQGEAPAGDGTVAGSLAGEKHARVLARLRAGGVA